MSQFNPSTPVSDEVASGMRYLIIAGAGTGIVYLIFFNKSSSDQKPLFDKVLDALPTPVKEVIQPVAGLEKSGLDLAREAADKGLGTQAGAQSAASAVFKATPYGRLSSVLDPHNSNENRIAQFALNALSVNPFLAAVNWLLPAPKVQYDSPVQKWCDEVVHNKTKMQILAAGKPQPRLSNITSYDSYKAAETALLDYRNALSDISPCISTPSQWDQLKKLPVFDGRDADTFATNSNFIVTRHSEEFPRAIKHEVSSHWNYATGYKPYREEYLYDFTKVNSLLLTDKAFAGRFVPQQQSMLSTDYWKGIFD